jgi:hypothetical protein
MMTLPISHQAACLLASQLLSFVLLLLLVKPQVYEVSG